MNLPSWGRFTQPVIWFGGKAGKRNPQPGQWVKTKVVYTGDSKYELVNTDTQEVALTCTLVSKIHWAKVEEAEPAPVEPAAREAAKPEPKPRVYEVPEKWLELAEEGNTEAAHRYWTRRCQEWRPTGKWNEPQRSGPVQAN